MVRGALLSQGPKRSGLKKDHPATFSSPASPRAASAWASNSTPAGTARPGPGSRISCGRPPAGYCPDVHCQDALSGLQSLEESTIDCLVTSPPYWSILGKRDHKAKTERLAQNLPTEYGADPRDLATVADYGDFLQALGAHFPEHHRVLKATAY